MIRASRFVRRAAGTLALAAVLAIPSRIAGQQPPSVDARLKGFDQYMAQVMKDWDAPGIGIGIVVKDKHGRTIN